MMRSFRAVDDPVQRVRIGIRISGVHGIRHKTDVLRIIVVKRLVVQRDRPELEDVVKCSRDIEYEVVDTRSIVSQERHAVTRKRFYERNGQLVIKLEGREEPVLE